MSNTVAVDKKLDTVDWSLFLGTGVALAGGLYINGLDMNGITTTLAVLTLVVLALLLWGMLTGHDKVAQFIIDHQMVALAASVLIAASSLLTVLTVTAIRSTHSG